MCNADTEHIDLEEISFYFMFYDMRGKISFLCKTDDVEERDVQDYMYVLPRKPTRLWTDFFSISVIVCNTIPIQYIFWIARRANWRNTEISDECECSVVGLWLCAPRPHFGNEAD